MKDKDGSLGQSASRDPDLANAEIALRRAARKAREIAIKNKSYVVYSINGKIVKETPSIEENTNQ